MDSLRDRVAVVTGAGRGIGRAVALGLAAERARVVVNDAGVDPAGRGHDGGLAATVCREIQDAGGTAASNDADVSTWDGAAAVVEDALTAFGRIDILVNNAGIVRYRHFAEMTEDQWDAVVAVHLKGTFNCCRHAVPHMRSQGHGRIINMISASVQGFPVQANYVAAKAGVLGLTMALAVELRGDGITANAFAPSGHTRLLAMMRPPKAGDDMTPGPGSEADANAPMVAWLASDRARHVNGQVFGWGAGRYDLYQQLLTPVASYAPSGPPTLADVVRHAAPAFQPYLQPVGRAIDERVLADFVARVDGDDGSGPSR